MGIKLSHVAAVLIAGGVVGWMWSGDYVEGGTGPRGEPVIIAERNATAEATPFAVRTRVLTRLSNRGDLRTVARGARCVDPAAIARAQEEEFGAVTHPVLTLERM